MNRRTGSIAHRIVQACDRREGRSMAEIYNLVDAKRTVIGTTVPCLVRAAAIFKAGVRMHFRYFVRAEDARAWEAANPLVDIKARRALPAEERRRLKNQRYSERRKKERLEKRLANPISPTPRGPRKRSRRTTGRYAELRLLLPRLAAQPEGFKTGSVNGHSRSSVDEVRREFAFVKCGSGPATRYFATPELAAAWTAANVRAPKPPVQAAVNRPPQRPAPKPAEAVKSARPKGKPASYYAVVPSKKPTQKKAVEVKVIVPENVKRTICPTFEDTRFKPDPSIAGRGAISGDWFMRRQEEAKRLQGARR